jgi:hypothetical protein
MTTARNVLDYIVPAHSSPADKATAVERFKQVWAGVTEKSQRGDYPRPTAGKFASLGRRAGPADAMRQFAGLDLDAVEKSMSPDALASIRGSLDAAKAAQADLTKAWTFSNPSTQLVPYDLLPVVQLLVNRKTPLVDRIPTGPAEGTAHHFDQVTGWSNSGQGGVPNLMAGLSSDSASTAFGPISLRRGTQISYATKSGSVLMIEHGLSDQVDWGIGYAMEGLQDARQLSHTGLLWSSLGAKEREHLYGRGNQSGYSGALAAPTAVSVAAAAASAGQTGNTANIANLYVYVCANSGAGDSLASTVVGSTGLSATTGDVVNVSFTGSAGALFYDVFAGTAAGIANAWYCGSTQTAGAGAFTINFTGGGTGGCPNSGAQPPAADASASTYSYDGLLTVAANPSLSGYTKQLNAALSTTTPGVEIQACFAGLYGQGIGGNFNLADPDEIFLTASIRRQLSELLKTTSSTNYRFTAQIGDNGVVLGGLVTGMQNETTGKDNVPLTVHPYMPAGSILVQSFTLPIPDSRVTSTVIDREVQPFMAIDWPDIQMSWDISTYWFGALVHYAPAWSGSITQINN